MNLSIFFNLITTSGSLFLIIVSVFLFIIFYLKCSKTVNIVNFFHKHSLILITTTSFLAIVGSLIYSEIFKFEPCLLCWWQRVFIYPVFFIALVALIKKEKNPFQYINPLIWWALIFSLYHNYLIITAQNKDVFLCDTDLAGACSERYVEILSIIDIPFMALSVILFIAALSFISLKNLRDK